MKIIFALFFLLSHSSAVWASGGDRIGNGGGGVICRDSGGKTLSVESYDLFESAVILKWADVDMKSTRSAESIEKEVWERVKTHSPGFEAILKIAMGEVNRRLVFVDRVKRIDDVTIKPLPFGCHFVQVAVWNDRNGTLQVNRALYEKMLPIQQLSLKFHEAFYFYQRQAFDIRGSDLVKWTVAGFFQKYPNYHSKFIKAWEDFNQARESLGLQQCHAADVNYMICPINWSHSSDYASSNSYDVTIESLNSFTGQFAVKTGESDHHLGPGGLHLRLKNEMNFPHPFAYRLAGKLSLRFKRIYPYYGENAIYRITIHSKATGQAFVQNFELTQDDRSFILSW